VDFNRSRDRRDADRIVASYLSAIDAEGGWRAAEALLSRVFGTPTQRTEDVTAQKALREMSPEELVAQVDELLKQAAREYDVNASRQASSDAGLRRTHD
jgi:hypothetical protein